MFGLFGSSRQDDKPKVPSAIGGNLNSGVCESARPNSLSLQSTHNNLSDVFSLTNPFDMGGFLAAHHFPLKIESKDVVYERYVAHINALNHTIMLRNANVGTAHLNACHCDFCAPRYLKSA